ncbi:hypothetical protein N4235_23380 [Enterobacter asburiae]|uniref:hypothetical protein n=1 Tax=Enterobacter asburiae TaxID=61645 RepID=UPI002966B2D4|nr:hypothetical protein [Enterobacter asburiae]MDW3573814.1 hypothetical protein [Enterobacter asburiae]
MSTITIGWLNKCRCGNKSHTVKTARGNETALWDDDTVKCNSCGRGGVIQVCEGQARVLWETDEEMAENKPMSTITKEFTKEQLQQIEAAAKEVLWPVVWSEKKAREHFSEKITAKVVLKLARIALASLETEPAIHRWRRVTVEPYGPYPWHYGNFIGFSKPVEGIEDEYFYSAPPAPVSVPDFDTLRLLFETSERESDHGFNLHKCGIGYADDATQARWEAWIACRAAMLQGTENVESRSSNSPVIPDGWVACSERMPGEVLAALQNVARLRRNLNDFCGDKSLIAKCLSEAEGALLNAVNRHSTMLAEPLKEAKNV